MPVAAVDILLMVILVIFLNYCLAIWPSKYSPFELQGADESHGKMVCSESKLSKSERYCPKPW